MPGEPSPQLKDYLDYQDSVKGKPVTADIILTLHQKAREAGLPQEARHHLLKAGHLFPAAPGVRELMAQELNPEEFGKWEAEHTSETPFWHEIGSIIRYPAASGALMMLGAAALGLSMARILEDLMQLVPIFKIFSVPAFMVGGLAWFVMVIILPGFFRTIVWETVLGKDGFPSWPGFADPFGQVIAPTLKALLVLMWSFLPLTLVLLASFRSAQPPPFLLVSVSLIFGCLYFPMAFLSFAVSDKLWPSLLPSHIIEAIAKSFVDYLKLAALFWLFLIPALASVLLWHLPLVGAPIAAFLSLYCWAAAMRLLGRFYRLEAGRLEWM